MHTTDLPDVSRFIETVRKSRGLFNDSSDIFITRAPGRLDVMGGIADYSGSLVLEMPIAEAVLVALQKSDDRTLRITSLGIESTDRTQYFEMDLGDFENAGESIDYAAAHRFFKKDGSNSWAAYVAGAFLVLMREKEARFDSGARILIDSGVPEGKGVSSSAAIEVAVMTAVTAAFDIDLAPRESARLCQKVENLVVGAPCGIMDQMSSMFGEENRLISMVCQPAELGGTIEIPKGLAFWGIDSGIRHSVGSGDYGSVRTGAFMGYRIIADLARLRIDRTDSKGVVRIEDDRWKGYLANILPEEFEKEFSGQLPGRMSGAEFLHRYQGITDRVTRVDPEKTYAILFPTAHPIYENARVRRFAELISAPDPGNAADDLGALMYASHESYSSCGLGTSGTDRLVGLVRRSKSLHGAKITGGGSGGTVAVLGDEGAEAEVRRVADEYESETGHRPHIFSGSSPGAAAFGYLKANDRKIN